MCTEYIDLFFAHLLKVPELKGFEVVEKFLELSNRKDFLKYLNTSYKLKKREDVKEMVHEAGRVRTEVTATLITFTKNAAAFAKTDRACLDESHSDLNRLGSMH